MSQAEYLEGRTIWTFMVRNVMVIAKTVLHKWNAMKVLISEKMAGGNDA